MARYEHLASLAEELGKSTADTKKRLRGLAIPVVDGFFDTLHYDALTSSTREMLGLSDHLGLGAVQKVLTPLNLKIIAHDYRGHNELWIAATKNNRVHVKMYFTRHLRKKTGHFNIRNFWTKQAPDYYLLFALEGPIAWVASKSALRRLHTRIKTDGSLDVDDRGFSIPKEDWSHPGGVLRAALHSATHELLLTDRGQLGL